MSGPSQPQYDTKDEDHFLHEYQKVDVDLVREGHKHTKLPLNYVQVGARELPDEANPSDAWDFVTCLYWPSTFVVWKGFQSPAYQETAGKHVFCRLDQKGVLARKVGEVGTVTERFVGEGEFAVHVFHRRAQAGDELGQDWYSIWKDDVTPKDTEFFFKGTQFSGGLWHEFTAVERLVIRNGEEAALFWKDNRASMAGSPGSTCVVGGTASVAI
ncbi:family hydrolase [Diaporthe eres]|nr:family hydrolase [Diaporthe eres]